MSKVSFIIPEKQQEQLWGMIDYYSETHDPEIEKYLKRLAVTIKSINFYYDIGPQDYNHKFQPINRSPFGKYDHGNSTETGFLKAPLDDCIARNVDESNRLVAFELDKGVIALVNVLGHYEENVFNEKGYLEQIVGDLKSMYTENKEEYLTMKDSSEFILNTLFSCVTLEQVPIPKLYGDYKKDCKASVFPVGLDTLEKSFNSSKNSLIANRLKPNKKSEIERERKSLDNLDNNICRTLRNICNLSYFIARASGKNELVQMKDLVKTNDKTVAKFINLLTTFNDSKEVFRVPSEVLDKKLRACKDALNLSFKYSVDSEMIASFISVFKKEVDSDVNDILKKNESLKGDFNNNDLQFKNTTILLEELTSSLTNKQPLYILNKDEMQISDKVIYFNVPHEEREQAKALGAKWNINAHCWYVPKGINVKPFDEKGWQRVNPKDIEKSIQEKKERDSFRSMLNSESKEKVIERKQEVQSVKKGRSR